MIPEQRHSLHLKQTEIALKKINQHEKMKQLQMMTMLSIPTQNSSNVYGNAIKIFEPKQKVKIQMLPNSLSYYRMLLSPQIDSKIIIRHFRGGMTELYICFDKLVKQLNKATYHFVLKDQMIVKFSPKHLENSKYIFLIFKNSSHLSFFVFRIDFVKKQKTTKQVRMDKSIGNVSIEFSETEASVQKLKRSKSSKGKLKKIAHITASEAILMKPEYKLKRILQLREQFEQKKEAATKRVQNIEIHKQKQMEAMKVVSTCKKMFNTYQQLVSQEEVKKQNIIQQSVPIMYVIKYCLLSSIIFNERQKNMKRALTIRSFEKKFIRKIRRAYRQTKILQPNDPVRQLQPLTQLVCLIGNSLNRKDRKQSAKVMYDVFANCLPGFFINLSMNISSNYRRIVRVIQRRWKARFGARMRMLLIYSQQQLQVILLSYPQLKYVQKQFRESNKMHEICIQYQKETANKMKDLLSAYENKLEQIEEYKRINKQIRQYNEGALKKKQKELLEIPKKPALPIFRFFRDLLFMKSMIRGELEILFRKFKKKNPQLFEKQADLSPKKDKKGK